MVMRSFWASSASLVSARKEAVLSRMLCCESGVSSMPVAPSPSADSLAADGSQIKRNNSTFGKQKPIRVPTCVGFPCPRGQHCILLPLEEFFCWRPPCRYPLHPVCVANIIHWPPIRIAMRRLILVLLTFLLAVSVAIVPIDDDGNVHPPPLPVITPPPPTCALFRCLKPPCHIPQHPICVPDIMTHPPVSPPLPVRPPTCAGFRCPPGQHCILLPLEIFFCLRPPCRYPLHPVCVPNIIHWPPIRIGDRD
ncbi:hypothetical protein PRIPAC_81515 [Pristionchus pacificus]|uniref:Uncharacterized protein n=1 Tax=Pristionchus pacificus TaxID=54126 RepID=A0A2A6CNE1_PRIPA|nr:hypothetical protein PRIPAC_81515 [Pristionchus pacificus]|eukprot:PDM79714.1 hypothetical protein PRIPAC_32293 [Pristionchus pacificus]